MTTEPQRFTLIFDLPNHFFFLGPIRCGITKNGEEKIPPDMARTDMCNAK